MSAWLERAFGAVYRALAVLVFAMCAVSFLLWVFPGQDPHGGVLTLVLALFLAPVGLALLISARAMRSGWRLRWVLLLLPLAAAAILPALLALS